MAAAAAGSFSGTHHDLSRAILAQIEYYFGDQNYPKDTFLQQRADSNGWVPLERICKFKKMALLLGTTSLDRVARILDEHPSKVVELSCGRGHKVRRRPLEGRVQAQIEYYFGSANFPKDLHLQQLMESNGGYAPLKDILGFKKVRDAFDAFQALGHPGLETLDQRVHLTYSWLKENEDLEVSATGAAVRPSSLARRVRLTIERLFSSPSFEQNEALQELVNDGWEGWVKLYSVLSLPEVRALVLPQAAAVAAVLSDSAVVEVTTAAADVKYIRRKEGAAAAAAAVPALPAPVAAAASPWILMPPMTSDPSSHFTLVTFNTLAKSYAYGAGHSNVPREHLDWAYRKWLFLQAVQRCMPDILGLQEVQLSVSGELLQDLKGLGYDGFYQQKIGLDGFALNKGSTLGNMLLWRSAAFQRAAADACVPFAPLLAKECWDDMTRDHYGLPQVGLVGQLKHLATGREVQVAVTHIACHFKNQEKQAAQVAVLLRHLQQRQGVPTLLCGDFNAQPGSEPYELCRTGQVDAAVLFSDPAVPALPFLETFQHGLCLVSAYSDLDAPGFFTTMRGPSGPQDPGFTGCLDYIWFSQASLERREVLSLPPHDLAAAENTGGLPNSWCPSDHLPLGAAFRFL